MATDDIRGDRVYTGTVTYTGTINLPAGTIDNADVNAGAAIAATKLQHRHAIGYGQVDGTDVVTATIALHVARGDGQIISVEIRPQTAPTGGDKQYTADIQKGADAGSYSTILSAAIVLNSSSANNTLQAGTLSTTTFSDGDAFEAIITASGSTGSQGQGFVITLNIDENAT